MGLEFHRFKWSKKMLKKNMDFINYGILYPRK